MKILIAFLSVLTLNAYADQKLSDINYFNPEGKYVFSSVFNHSTGDVNAQGTSGDTTLNQLNLGLSYGLSERLSLGFNLAYSKYEIDLDGFAPNKSKGFEDPDFNLTYRAFESGPTQLDFSARLSPYTGKDRSGSNGDGNMKRGGTSLSVGPNVYHKINERTLLSAGIDIEYNTKQKNTDGSYTKSHIDYSLSFASQFRLAPEFTLTPGLAYTIYDQREDETGAKSDIDNSFIFALLGTYDLDPQSALIFGFAFNEMENDGVELDTVGLSFGYAREF